MASNTSTLICRGITLGTTETAPGYPFVRLVSPTDFDFAFENMRIRIRDTHSFWQGLDYLGLFAGQLKQFLTSYIETAGAEEKPYIPEDKQWWLNTLEQKYPGRFENDNLQVYLDTLYALQKENQVPVSIYKPYTYTPEKPSMAKSLAEVTGVDYTKIIMAGAVLAAVYAFAGGGYKHLLGRKK